MTQGSSAAGSGRKLLFGLFVFPLLIAVGMAVLLGAIVFLTHERQTPETLIADIKTGPPSRRWEKAYELSNELNRSRDALRSESLQREIIRILQDPGRYDARTRTYAAAALGRFRTNEAAGALAGALADPEQAVRLHALWSLGTSSALSQAGRIRPLLTDEDAEIRKVAAYVLGAVGDARSLGALESLLSDPVADVRWNAALALARLGSDAGLETLTAMLDREALSSEHGLDEPAARAARINALRGLALIGSGDSIRILESISKKDPDLKVRQAAIDAAHYIRGKARETHQ